MVMDLNDLKQMIKNNCTKKQLLEAVDKMQEETIDVKWSIDDLWELHPDCKKVSREDALEIARLAEKYHDAQYGVNWDYLQQTASNYFNDKVEEQDD